MNHGKITLCNDLGRYIAMQKKSGLPVYLLPLAFECECERSCPLLCHTGNWSFKKLVNICVEHVPPGVELVWLDWQVPVLFEDVCPVTLLVEQYEAPEMNNIWNMRFEIKTCEDFLHPFHFKKL
jgi:hypothetical protein